MHPVATGFPCCLPSFPSITTRRPFAAYTACAFPYSLGCRVCSVTAVAQQAVLSVKLLCPSAHTLATTQPLSPGASTSTFKTHRPALGGCLYDAFMQPAHVGFLRRLLTTAAVSNLFIVPAGNSSGVTGRDTALLCHVLARDVAPLAVSVSSFTVVSPGQQSTLPALRKPLLSVEDAAPPTR
jgi:hypothetical protein